MKPIYLLLTVCLLSACEKEIYEDLEPIYVEQFVDTIGQSRAIPADYMVKTGNKIYWNTGEQVTFSHVDVEGGLHPSWQTQDADYSRALARRKINARTYTLRGDDVTSIHPYTNTWQKIPDRAKMEGWKARWLVFINECKARGMKPVIIVYIGERTNWYKPLSEYQAWLTVLSSVLRSGEDISGYFVFGIEEIGQRQGTTTLYSDNEIAAWWNPINAMLKALFPYSITMLHNNPNDKFWRSTSPVLIVDMISLQEKSSSGVIQTIDVMRSSAIDAMNRGYAVHFHECYNCFQGSESQDISALNYMLSATTSLGLKDAAIFDPAIDTQRPDTTKNRNLQIRMGNYLYGNIIIPDDTVVIPPPTGNIKIEYSVNFSLTPSTELTNGATLPVNGMWFGVKQGTGTFTFKLQRGTSIQNATDGTAPFQFKAWLQRGSYTLTVTNGNAVEIRNFTVN